MPPNGWWWGAGPWWVFPIIMPVMMIFGLLIVLFIMREFFGGGPSWRYRRGRPEGDEALDILRRRFASGELTEAEFEAKRKLLQRP